MSAKRGHASISSQKINQGMTNTKSSIGNRHTFRDFRGSKSIMAVNSFSRRGVPDEERQHKPTKTNNVKVIDENGIDVTPRSLLSSGALSALKRNQSLVHAAGLMESSSVTGIQDVLGQSIYDASMIQSSFAPGFTRSINGSTAGSMSRMSFDSATDESIVDHHVIHHSPVHTDVQQLNIEELESMIEINLEETDTIWHLDIPGTSLSTDNEIANTISESNKRYEQVLENRPGNDMYVHSEMQTFNNDRKTKGTQSSLPQMQDVGVTATTWDMYDTFSALLPIKAAETKEIKPKQASDTVSHGTNNASTMTKDSRPFSAMTASRASLMTSSDTTEDNASRNDQEEAITERILNSQNMRDSLFTIERVIMQNVFHERQASYRGYAVLSEDEPTESTDPDLGACLERLWIHACPPTKGKSVNCFAWNKSNQDILAAGYGMYGTRINDTGIVCCWSVKNPETPERRFSVPSPVMSLDFSTMKANLLAVGLYDGSIMVFDIRMNDDTPCLDTRESAGKHCGPVWQLNWVFKGSDDDKDEVLVSVSADGRVTQWSIRKGFEHVDLMKLKRTTDTQQQTKGSASKSEKKNEALISRYSQAVCISFHPTDSNIYLVGSEDGHLHKCSCSYNEQSLEVYSGHTGCVYKVHWSPFVDNVFLSCSSDWSVRLWNQDNRKSIFELKSTMKRNSVVDCDWSPMSSTVFTSIDECCLEVWDLNINTLDPMLSFAPVHENKLTAVSFSRTSPSIFVGDEDGNISVYILRHCDASLSNKGDILIKSMTSTQLHTNPIDGEISSRQQSNIDIKEK